MRDLFSLDSKPMQFLSYLFDLMVLNLLFLVTCIPVVTIGAASTAMYTVCFRLGTDREEGMFRTYFRAFKENFRQSTGMFLILGLGMALSLFAVRLLMPQPGWMGKVAYLWSATLMVLAFVYSYAFPLQSQFVSPVKVTLKNALLLSLGYFPRTVVVVLLDVLPLALLLLDPVLLIRTGYVWIFLYFSVAAFLNSRLLGKVFAPYMKKEEEAQ